MSIEYRSVQGAGKFAHKSKVQFGKNIVGFVKHLFFTLSWKFKGVWEFLPTSPQVVIKLAEGFWLCGTLGNPFGGALGPLQVNLLVDSLAPIAMNWK